MTEVDVIGCLSELFSTWGGPICIRSDNGAGFVARRMKK